MPSSRVVVCGAPNLDNRPRQTGLIHPLLQARLGLQPGRPWILVATSGPGHRISHKHHQIVIENLARLSAELADVPVVVKLHRKDRLEYYQQTLQKRRHRLILVREESSGFPRGIFEWLTGCSVVLTGASTVAVEAMLMDVPVVTMDFCQEIRGVDFIDCGATTHVQTLDALSEAVRRCLGSGTSTTAQAVRKYLAEAYFALDGRSSDRAAASLLEMAGA
jgi:UDP-N-acetylglucosamine 2-epimerase